MVPLLVLLGCGGGATLGSSEAGSAGSSAAGTSGGAGTSSAAGTGAAGQGGSPVAGATGTQPCALRLAKTWVNDGNGDGLFVAPDRILVGAEIESSDGAKGPITFRVTSDDPRIAAEGAPEVTIPMIAAGARATAEMTFLVPIQVTVGSEVGFTLTASLAGEPTCATPATEPIVLEMSKYAWDRGTCAATRQIVLSDIAVAGTGPDIQIMATMTNPGPLDQHWYPYLHVTSDVSGITQDPLGGGGLYALAAGWTSSVTALMRVDPSVPRLTLVRLTASAAAINVRCRNIRTYEIQTHVQ